RNGFRLSLFGFDPERDYRAITHELMGRRINRTDPANSLLLLKALGAVEHGGGRRFGPGSWQYRLLYDWIPAAAPWKPGSGEVENLTLAPPDLAFRAVGQVQKLKVIAQCADKSEEDVTPLCDIRINDAAVAEMASLGEIKALRAGDTA